MHVPLSPFFDKNAQLTKRRWAERLNRVSHRAASIFWILHLTSQEAKFIPLTYSSAFCWIWMPGWVYLMRHRKALHQWTRTAEAELPTDLLLDRLQVPPGPWRQVSRRGDDTFRHQTQSKKQETGHEQTPQNLGQYRTLLLSKWAFFLCKWSKSVGF